MAKRDKACQMFRCFTQTEVRIFDHLVNNILRKFTTNLIEIMRTMGTYVVIVNKAA